MEGLRQALLAPACGTFLLLGGCIVAMKDMVECRYSLKDENGKILLRHPYKPWEPVDQKHEEMAERAFRAFKMNENVKEWTFMSVPLVWSIAIFGGDLPYVTPIMVDTFVIASCLSYALVNHRYIKGYVESPSRRIQAFYLRFTIWKIWLILAGLCLLWGILQRFGLDI